MKQSADGAKTIRGSLAQCDTSRSPRAVAATRHCLCLSFFSSTTYIVQQGRLADPLLVLTTSQGVHSPWLRLG